MVEQFSKIKLINKSLKMVEQFKNIKLTNKNLMTVELPLKISVWLSLQ